MTYDDIRDLIYLKTKTNISSLPNANLNLYTQPAEDHIASLIMHSDVRWEYDDANRADLPIATTTVTSGQQDYSLPTSHLRVFRAEIKDSNGVWRKLQPLDKFDEPDEALSYRTANESGVPDQYDLVGNSVFLYPVPNYTQAASLKIYFQRGALKYDYTANSNAGQFTDGTGSGATTDTPGFSELYHSLIADWAAYNYAVDNGLKTTNGFLNEIQRKEKDVSSFYGRRNSDDRNSITMKKVHHR